MLTIASLSSFSPRWMQTADVLVYPGGAAVGVPPDDPSAPPSLDLRLAYPAVSPRQAGSIDACALPDLLARGSELAGQDRGPTVASDLPTATVDIAADGGRPAVSFAQPGLAASGGAGVTPTQQQARQDLRDWILAVRSAIHPTVTLPVDRLRLVEVPSPAPSSTQRKGRAGSWDLAPPVLRRSAPDGTRYDAPCVVLTGDDARRAAAAMATARETTDNRIDALMTWRFVVDGRTRTFGMVALAPGEGCV